MDNIYKALITGCALAGPEECAIASEGDTPLDVNDTVQALLKAAHDATRKNSSVPLTSGQIRSKSRTNTEPGLETNLSSHALAAQFYYQVYFPTTWRDSINEFYLQAKAIVDRETHQNRSVTLYFLCFHSLMHIARHPWHAIVTKNERTSPMLHST